ncbi:NAD(P)-dependent oxidoreductase [Shigella flexneri]
MLAERDGFSLYDCTVGIVGVGNVGRRLQARLEALGIKTLLCDLPCADSLPMRVIPARWMSLAVQRADNRLSIRHSLKRSCTKRYIWRS